MENIFNKKKADLLLKRIFSYYDKTFSVNRPSVLFGAGTIGNGLVNRIYKNKIPIIGFSDNDRKLWGSKIGCFPVINVSSLDKNIQILISSIIFQDEIYNSLKLKGFKNVYPFSYLCYKIPKKFDLRDYKARYTSIFQNSESIKQADSLFADKQSREVFRLILRNRLRYYYKLHIASICSKNEQYFDPEIISLTDNELFVDAGGYTGDTIDKFILTNRHYRHIYSFEPDKLLVRLLRNHIITSGISRCTVIKKGLYNRRKQVYFYDLGTSESGIGSSARYVSLSGDQNTAAHDIRRTISVTTLDRYFEKKAHPTFIKMDIEGSEYNALLGSKHIIQTSKPKLAICVYHKPNDLWEIPILIKSFNNKYKIYLRHYTKEVSETVCYAI